MPSASGTSVTATREYATWVVATAASPAPVHAAAGPYARRPSHHAAATDATPRPIATSRAAPYDGSSAQAWNGASA